MNALTFALALVGGCVLAWVALTPALRAWLDWLDDRAVRLEERDELAGSIWAFTDRIIPQAGPDLGADLPELRDTYSPESKDAA